MKKCTGKARKGQSLVETAVVVAALVLSLAATTKLCQATLAGYYRRVATLISLPIP